MQVMMPERWNDQKVKSGKLLSIYVQEQQSQSLPGLSSLLAKPKLQQTCKNRLIRVFARENFVDFLIVSGVEEFDWG